METLDKNLKDNSALNSRIEELSKQLNAENAGIKYSTAPKSSKSILTGVQVRSHTQDIGQQGR